MMENYLAIFSREIASFYIGDYFFRISVVSLQNAPFIVYFFGKAFACYFLADRGEKMMEDLIPIFTFFFKFF